MLSLELLESRDLPSVTLLDGTLFVLEQGPGIHTVSIFNPGPGQVQVTEGDGDPADDVASLFDAAQVTGLVVLGSRNGANVIYDLTRLPSLLLGGDRADTIFGGSGSNWIDPGAGKDYAYSLLGTNRINTAGDGEADQVFTNYNAIVSTDPGEQVVRFFGSGRTPGSGFIGLDTTLNDGVLYIAPTNNGSFVILDPGTQPGEVVASYDLADGAGPQTQLFEGVQFVSYFGGSGVDTYLNNTSISEAAYGGAGNDVVVGGTGEVSFLKGLGGNDVVVGRADHNDISGNAGADVLVDLGQHKRDVIRADALDFVFALSPYIAISP